MPLNQTSRCSTSMFHVTDCCGAEPGQKRGNAVLFQSGRGSGGPTPPAEEIAPSPEHQVSAHSFPLLVEGCFHLLPSLASAVWQRLAQQCCVLTNFLVLPYSLISFLLSVWYPSIPLNKCSKAAARLEIVGFLLSLVTIVKVSFLLSLVSYVLHLPWFSQQC